MKQLQEGFKPASYHKQMVEDKRSIRGREGLVSKNFQEIGKRLEWVPAETNIPQGLFED